MWWELLWAGRLVISLSNETYDGIPGTRLDEADEAKLRDVDALLARVRGGG